MVLTINSISLLTVHIFNTKRMTSIQSFKVSTLNNFINDEVWKANELLLIYDVYRCSFLGILHMDVFLQWLEQVEYLISLCCFFFKYFAAKEFIATCDTSIRLFSPF